jgi:hypothetical protein
MVQNRREATSRRKGEQGLYWGALRMQVGVEYNDEDEDEKWHHHQLNPTTLCTFLASLDLFFNWSPFFFLKMISFLFETLFPLSLF